MAKVLIRDLDDDLVDSFKNEAKRRGVSMQVVLKQTLNENRPKVKSKAEILQQIDALRAKTGPEKSSLALELTREGRDYLDRKVQSLSE